MLDNLKNYDREGARKSSGLKLQIFNKTDRLSTQATH